MAASLRIIAIVSVLTYSLIFGSGYATASGTKHQRSKVFRFKVQRINWFGVKRVYFGIKRVPAAPKAPIGNRAVSYAKKFIGVPYRYGGSSPSGGFDCSGFVRYVYSRFGINLPHSSYADFNLGRHISRWALKPGDLVFFEGVGHVGMYVGNGMFIHAPHTGTHVQISSMAGGYGSAFDGARRIVTGAKRRLLHG